MYLFTSLTSVLAWKRVYPRKFDALFRPGRRHPVQTQTPSVQSTAENLSCTGSLPEQKPAAKSSVGPGADLVPWQKILPERTVRPQTSFAVGTNHKIRRSVKMGVQHS